MSSLYIRPRFDFSTAIAGVGSGQGHTVQRVNNNEVKPSVFNEYERLFGLIADIVGDYNFSESFSDYHENNNNIGSAIRFVFSDTNFRMSVLDSRKFDKQGGTISGDVVFMGSIQVSGTSVFNGAFVLNNNLTVGSAAIFDSTVKIYDKLSCLGSVDVKYDITTHGSVSVDDTVSTKNLIVTNQLSVASSSSFNSTLQVNTLNVLGASTFSGTITANSAITFNSQLTSSLTALAPFIISSQMKVDNLHVDLLDGWHAGNASGQIPVSNGTKNVNLYADILDGFHAGNAAGQIPVNNKVLCTNLNAQYLNSYPTSLSAVPSTIPVYNSLSRLDGGITGCSAAHDVLIAPSGSITSIVATFLTMYGTSYFTFTAAKAETSGYPALSNSTWINYEVRCYSNINQVTPHFSIIARNTTDHASWIAFNDGVNIAAWTPAWIQLTTEDGCSSSAVNANKLSGRSISTTDTAGGIPIYRDSDAKIVGNITGYADIQKMPTYSSFSYNEVTNNVPFTTSYDGILVANGYNGGGRYNWGTLNIYLNRIEAGREIATQTAFYPCIVLPIRRSVTIVITGYFGSYGKFFRLYQ